MINTITSDSNIREPPEAIIHRYWCRFLRSFTQSARLVLKYTTIKHFATHLI